MTLYGGSEKNEQKQRQKQISFAALKDDNVLGQGGQCLGG